MSTAAGGSPKAPPHQVVLFDLSNARQRQNLLSHASAIEAMTNEAFYQGRDKKVKSQNVVSALLNADAVILVFAEADPETILATMVGNILWHFSGNKVFIDDVITGPPYQRNGIQAKMMKAMEQFARDQQIERMALYTEEDNEAAKRSYEKGGFAVRSVSNGAATIVMVNDL